jgi:hypothetical protein
MSFEANQGQADSAVRFLARGQGYTILLKPSEAALALQSWRQGARFPEKAPARPTPFTCVLKMKIEGANPFAPAKGLDQLPGLSNYFIGNDPGRWHTNIPTYRRVRFEHIRPGVDLVYYGNHRQLEYDFVLSAGVEPQSLRLSFEGSDVAIDPQGDLVLTSTDGQVTFRRPVAYQGDKSNPAKKHFLAASYVLKGHNRVGFDVPDYDPHEPMVIDPVLNYSTYLGGNGGNTGNAVALDSFNDAYVTGSTTSINFPTSANPKAYQGSNGGDADAFVTKLRYDGEAVIYSTYLGGNNFDIGNGIALDPSGDAYIVGSTSSANFPTTANVFQPTFGGNTDAFVAKLDPSGSKLLYSTFLGGSDIDYGLALAVDQYGNAFVTGSTQSTDFPTANPIQFGNSGNGDAFVAEINPNLKGLSQLVYCTYLGGSSADSGQGIAVDLGGNAYVTGFTYSTNFPTYNAYQGSNAGSVDAFIAKLTAGGSSFVFSTYLGGSGDDRGWAIALDKQLNIYVAGSTRTPCFPATKATTMCNATETFPTTPGAFQSLNTSQSPGYSDVFVTKLNSAGTALIYSTLLGGSLTDSAAGIAVDSSGNAYVTGYTQSSDFPTANAPLASYARGNCGPNPCHEAFVTELNTQGSSLVYSTYLGGSAADIGNAIAVDSNNNAYVVGTTFSSDFPAIARAYQGQPRNTDGLSSAFISMVSHNNLAGVGLTPQKLDFGNVTQNTTSSVTSANVPATVTLTNAGTVPLQVTRITTSGDFAETDNCVGTIPAGGGRCTIYVTFTPAMLGAETYQLLINDDAAGSPHLVTVTGTGVTGKTAVQFTPTTLVFAPQTLNTTSPAQTVVMTNNGQTPLTVTNITASGDFTESNNCPSTPFTLAVKASCTFQITFTPTNTGTRTGALVVTDNVASGSSSIPLSGTGNPIFNLSSPTLTQTLLIGTTTTTFTISLSAPSSFTDTLTLSCASGICSFSPPNIALGSTTVPSSSTLTLSGLSASSTNPYFFSVTGTDATTGIGTATLGLTIFLSDFSLSASPAINSVVSGASAVYRVTVAPINGFSQPVVLSCLGTSLPQGASCVFSPGVLTPSGGAVTSQLTVRSTARSTSVLLPSTRPRIPPASPMILALWGTSILLALAVLLILGKMRFRGTRGRRRLIYAQVAFAALAFATAFWISCDSDVYTTVLQPSPANGTPTGNYTITIQGTYTGSTAATNGTTTTVSHVTRVNLTVL